MCETAYNPVVQFASGMSLVIEQLRAARQTTNDDESGDDNQVTSNPGLDSE